ncbi:hypothetical protein K445DRAFT_322579 [Daldinia sp. EC12]|nr:hypothetical protein K445DRAFT_322579 [Daldinia sp. EC12]
MYGMAHPLFLYVLRTSGPNVTHTGPSTTMSLKLAISVSLPFAAGVRHPMPQPTLPS